jgi:transposase-like protein
VKRSKKTRKCPRCASKEVLFQDTFENGTDLYVCADCDFEFEVGGSRSKRRNEDFDIYDDFDPEFTQEEWEN